MYSLKTINSKKIETIDIVIFLILFLSGSFLTSNDIIPSEVTKLFWLIVVGLILFKLKKNIIINYYIIGLIISFVISFIVNPVGIATYFYICVSVIIAILMINTWSFQKFRESYVKILFFLSVFSLIMMALFYIFPQMNNFFNVYNISKTAKHANYIIFTKIVNENGFGRNCGMFWEPGAYQTFICIALIFEISKPSPSVRKIIVFIITILTTFSTTGYIALLFVYIYLFFGKYNNKKQINGFIYLSILCITAILILFQDLFFSTQNYTPFGKIILYFTSDVYNSKVSSVSIRINSVVQPIIVFLNNPLFGVGDIKFRELIFDTTQGVTTGTFVNWFAVYGVFCGSLFMIGLSKLTKKLSNNRLLNFIIFIIFFIITMSENYITNTAIIIILLYGFAFNHNINKNSLNISNV